jgi:hypothetical protein
MVKYLIIGLVLYEVLTPSKPSTGSGGSGGSGGGGQQPNANNTGQVLNVVDDFVNAAKSFFQAFGNGSSTSKAQTNGATGPDPNAPNQTSSI